MSADERRVRVGDVVRLDPKDRGPGWVVEVIAMTATVRMLGTSGPARHVPVGDLIPMRGPVGDSAASADAVSVSVEINESDMEVCRTTPTLFGLEVADLPDDWRPTSAIVVVESVDLDDDRGGAAVKRLSTRHSEDLDAWKAIGMLQAAAADLTRQFLDATEHSE